MVETDFLIKTDIKVDVDILREDFLKNFKNWKNINNRICINSYSEKDSREDDAGQRLTYAPYEYIYPEFKNTIWEEVINKLPGKKSRARIMIMSPFKILDLHRDFEKRWHIPIITDPGCMMLDYEANKTYHLPADGYVYDVDTTKLHTAFNITTNVNRVHLVVSQYV